MKKVVTAFLLFICFQVYASKIDTIQYQYYWVVFDNVKKQPLEIRYDVLCNGTSTVKYSRKGMNFYKDIRFNCLSDKDFKANSYDKGHMMPAESVACNESALKSSFCYTNCVLQNDALNRGIWKKLETIERKLAQNGNISVHIKVIFTNSHIPKGFYKYIYKNGILIRKYYFNNVKPISKNLMDYEVK